MPSITPTLVADIAWMGGTLVSLEGGYHRIDGVVYALYVALTDEVSKAEKDEFLALFSHHKGKPGEATQWLRQWMKDAKMKQANVEQMPGYEDMFEKALEGMPIERRLSGLGAEEVLARYAPEERLAGLDRDHQALALPVEVLRIVPDAYIDSLSPEVRDEIRRRIQSAGH